MLRMYPRGSKRNLAMAGIATILMTSTAVPTLVHAGDSATLTPIKHVIIIIGENRTFDHIFATYAPVKGETVLNLLSQGIVNADGSPGPSYGAALQFSAFGTAVYQLAPPKFPCAVLPAALVGGTSTPYVCIGLGITTGTSCVSPAKPSTNNYYRQDGYGGGSGFPTAVAPNANYGGGSYSNCADSTQPGVGPVLNYLNSLSRKVNSNCESGHYYLLNNYNPGYFGDGTNAYTDTNASNYVFTIPPSNVRNIGDALNDKGVSWAYFGDQFNRYLIDKYDTSKLDEYCNICNFFQYSTSIMTNATVRKAHLKDTADLYASIASGGPLPAVSYVKPSGFVDGHPASSKLNLFEGFVKKIVDLVNANPTLSADTAIMITFDEGGGYWDSGYIQPLDFFGDGTRIP
jgi:phospholipase C